MLLYVFCWEPKVAKIYNIKMFYTAIYLENVITWLAETPALYFKYTLYFYRRLEEHIFHIPSEYCVLKLQE